MAKSGVAAVVPDDSRCGQHQRRRAEVDLIETARSLRRLHPSWGGSSESSAGRLAAHSGLEHSGRAYEPTREERRCWSPDRPRDLLAGPVVPRRVDRSGMASAYGRNRYVGPAYAGQVVHVRYDPRQQLWPFQGGEGHQLNRQKATESDAANIRGLMEASRRDRPGATGEGELGVGIPGGQLDVA